MISSSGPALHPADDPLDDVGAFGGFDDQRQLHRGRAELDGRLGVGILGAVDDQRPVDQVVQVRGLEAEPLAGDIRG